jgi:hypothetical protein
MKQECLLLDHDIQSPALYVRGLPEGSCSNIIQETVAERSLFTNDVLHKRKRSVKIVSHTAETYLQGSLREREREREKISISANFVQLISLPNTKKKKKTTTTTTKNSVHE